MSTHETIQNVQLENKYYSNNKFKTHKNNLLLYLQTLSFNGNYIKKLDILI